MRPLSLLPCWSLFAVTAALPACAQAAPSSSVDDPGLGAAGAAQAAAGSTAAGGSAAGGTASPGTGGHPGNPGGGSPGTGGNAAGPTGQGGTDSTGLGQGGAPATSGPATCADAHDATGCCGTDGNLYSCFHSSSPQLTTCASGPCGWSSKKSRYECNQSQSTDPGGSPRDCGGSGTGPGGGPTGGGVVPTTCAGAQDKVGCCAADTAYYCPSSTGQLTSKSCAPGTCGWDSAKHHYGCSTSGSPDPGGTPMDCTSG